MKKILVIGSLNMDMVTNVYRTPKVGETVKGGMLQLIPGGKGANQAVAAGKLGSQVAMCGMIGSDDYGQTLSESLKQNNVDTALLMKKQDYDTGKAFIMLNEDGDNSIVLIPGANNELLEEDLCASILNGIDILLVQLEIPKATVEKALKLAKERDIFTILNPAPAIDIDHNILQHVDLLLPNETEFEKLTGLGTANQTDLIEGAKVLIGQGVNKLLVTLGSNGAFYYDHEGNYKTFQAHKVKAIDTTAAGDSVVGAIAHGIAEGMDLYDAIEFSMSVGALTVSKRGAQESIPTINEVECFIKGAKL